MNRIRYCAVALVVLLTAAPIPSAVMISELMYKGVDDIDGTDGDLFEYVELCNTGSNAVDLAGGSFTRGITYTFPAGSPAILGPGAFLVVAKDRPAFQRRYPDVTNLAPGVYSGKLANEGESVAFRLASGVTDTVFYANSGIWPAAAYAFGPSLERICLTADGNTSVNWRASGATTDWVPVSWTTTPSVVSTALVLFLDYDGVLFIDDLSVRRAGIPADEITNYAFEIASGGWSASNSHALSRVEEGAGYGGSAGLAIQCNESRAYMDAPLYSIDYFGDPTNNRCVFMLPPLVSGTSYVVSLRARRDGVSGRLYQVLGVQTQVLDLGSFGTPGKTNSYTREQLPVGVQSVSHGSNICPIGVAQVVRVRFSDPARVAAAAAAYQLVPHDGYRYSRGDYTEVTLHDDGLLPDDVAGDGLFSAAIPAVTSNWTLVRYHVRAIDDAGDAIRSPTLDDPEKDYAYWVESSSPQTTIPEWHLLVDGDPVMHPHSRHACAISPDFQIFTDVMIKHRGNPESDLTRTGIGLHCHRTEKFNAWFAPQQKKINFRHRRNDWLYYYRRVIAEPLAYELQRLIGLPAPRLRHVCLWINGAPTITTELESPEDAFLTGNGIGLSDLVTRQSYSDGIELVGGDTNIDNFTIVHHALEQLTSATRNGYIRSNLYYESIQHSFALLALTGNADQDFSWNMFQHRFALDGRWEQFPWDVDLSFDITFSNAWTSLVNLHPYYRTPDHPSIWDTNYSGPLTRCFFYPESNDVTTLPYRHRQQTTLWRYCHTLFTTNTLFPRLNAMYTNLLPAYQQIRPFEVHANPVVYLGREVTNVMQFIQARRDFLMNGNWADQQLDLWSPTNRYDPGSVVISEIMHSPTNGLGYVELFNRGPHAVDLSRWTLQCGNSFTQFPFGVMLAPTSYLVLAGSASSLTNAYRELSDPLQWIERYPGQRIWDWPIVFTAATEYASRMVQMGGFAVSPGAGQIQLRDLTGRSIDAVAYTNDGSWPAVGGMAIERIDPYRSGAGPEHWRVCAFVGTPGSLNSATADQDDDAIPDEWEQRIVDESGGVWTNVAMMGPGADADADGLSNRDEFIRGTDPLLADAGDADLLIRWIEDRPVIEWRAIPLGGTGYERYRSRTYALLAMSNAPPFDWFAAPNSMPMSGSGTVQTNIDSYGVNSIGLRVELHPIRP